MKHLFFIIISISLVSCAGLTQQNRIATYDTEFQNKTYTVRIDELYDMNTEPEKTNLRYNIRVGEAGFMPNFLDFSRTNREVVLNNVTVLEKAVKKQCGDKTPITLEAPWTVYGGGGYDTFSHFKCE